MFHVRLDSGPLVFKGWQVHFKFELGLHVPFFIEDERDKTIEYFGNTKSFSRLLPGLQSIQKNQQALRVEIYEKTVSFWKKMEENNFLKDLESLLSEWNDRDHKEVSEGARESALDETL